MAHKKKKEGVKIKAIIFDWGNVVIFYDHMIAAKKMSKLIDVPANRIFGLLNGNSNKFTVTSDLGASPEEYWNVAAHELGISSIPSKKFTSLWNTIFWPNRKLLSKIKILKKSYKLASISNINQGHKKYVLKKYGLRKIFPIVVLSSDVRTRKPESKTYKITLKRLNVKPKEAIFIDNIQENVDGAKKAGIHGILFKNNSQLFDDMRKLGIEV